MFSDPANLVGKTVEWEGSGRGRGKFYQGEAVLHIPPGTSNAEAMKKFASDNPKHVIRRKYLRFDPETVSTSRLLVLVEQDTKRTRPTFWFYAPNINECTAI